MKRALGDSQGKSGLSEPARQLTRTHDEKGEVRHCLTEDIDFNSVPSRSRRVGVGPEETGGMRIHHKTWG